jgi:NADH-quinone oxidoreductase subunit J
MGLPEISFYYFAIVAVLTAFLAVTRPNPVYSVLFLVACFFHVAGLFVLMGAEFLAALQILVPAGALMILYLFVVFLFNLTEIKESRTTHRQAAIAGVVCLALVGLLMILTFQGVFPGPFKELVQSQVGDNVSYVGGSLYTTFLFPFELASLVLLVVLFGAIVLGKREERE